MKGLSCLAVSALLLWPPAVQTQSVSKSRSFTARLTPVPRDAAMMATITGSGSVSAVLTGTKLAVTGSFDGLQTPATVARIHKGVKTGVRGDGLFDLKVSAGTSGTITGAFDLTPAQVSDLEQGRLYVQLHSQKAPEGNLWGWLLNEENRR